MLYQLTSDDGDVIEIERSMNDPVRFGESVERDGKVYTRRVSAPAMAMARGVDRTGAVKAWSLPRKDAARSMGYAPAPHYDNDGFAVFRSRTEREKWLNSKNRDGTRVGDTYRYKDEGYDA